MDEPPKFLPEKGQDARKQPVRLLVVQGDKRPLVDATDEPMVMTLPHLIVREMTVFLALSLVMVVLSLAFDAPLEEIADPTRTPNPAKAPWYFLGLQELLHYYPPVVSGVLMPGALIVAIAIIPYFEINIERPSLWSRERPRRLMLLWSVVAALSAFFYVSGSQPVWPIIGPLWFVAVAMSCGAVPGLRGRFGRWLHIKSLAFWIFLWFVLTACTLTTIGVFFRGPGWNFVLPWRDGVYY